MFSLKKNDHEKRQARVYTVNKRATFSRLSLLSSSTSRSKRSTGSASTITQESYLKSERSRKRRHGHSAKHRSTKGITSSMQAEKKPRRVRQNSTSDIDVFSYLVKDIADPSGASTSWEAERRRVSKRASVQDDPDETETKSVKSRLSDSNVSFNDSGYDSTSPSSYMKPRLGSLPEHVFVEDHEHLQQRHYQHPPDLASMSPNFAQSYTHPQYHYPNPCWPSPPGQQSQLLIDEQCRNGTTGNSPVLSGYDLVASRLAEKGDLESVLPPLYRRFSALNHRILLQIQDEIAEMEADLRRLDEADAHYRRGQPASRRSDWGSLRLDLLGKIYVKTEQYHSAIMSMQKVKSATSEADNLDLKAYREWLREHKPLQEAEMRFLDNEEDIMSLHVPPPSSSPIRQSTPKQYDFHLLSSVAGVWLLACVPSIFSRLTFFILLTLFTIATQPSTLNTIDRMEAWTRLKTIAIPLTFWMIVTTIC